MYNNMLISIHALVKRATLHLHNIDLTSCNFNPRPREEGDLLAVRMRIFITAFQSTPS